MSSTTPTAQRAEGARHRAFGRSYGQYVPGLVVDGRELSAGVFNEHEVRTAAGITMLVGAVAFCYAYFEHKYIGLQTVASFFFVEFLLRVTFGIRYSPVGIVSQFLVRHHPAQWVSAKPKRFAWSIGLGIAFAMTIITNSGVRGWLPRSMCLLCLSMMWLESAMGLCVGCKVYGLLMRRGWVQPDEEIELCADGSCAVPWLKADE